LSEAAAAVGLWPAAGPEEEAADLVVPLVRRPLACPASGTTHSLTATVRQGRFTAVSVFDEAPDWLCPADLNISHVSEPASRRATG
jgi:hypothetical protein